MCVLFFLLRQRSLKTKSRRSSAKGDRRRARDKQWGNCTWEDGLSALVKIQRACLLWESGKQSKGGQKKEPVAPLPRTGKKRSDRLCWRREKREEKQGTEREQPTCYHTVFNNSVAATRGLHVHATAVQCLLSVCAAHKRAPVQKSSHSALSVSSRQQQRRPLTYKRCVFAQKIYTERLHLRPSRNAESCFLDILSQRKFVRIHFFWSNVQFSHRCLKLNVVFSRSSFFKVYIWTFLDQTAAWQEVLWK